MSLRRVSLIGVGVILVLGMWRARTEVPIPTTRSPEVLRNGSPSLGRLTLKNGLVAVWEEDHRQPLVALEARILGGLRGEGRYLGTGITHFLEHMLFKGTPSRPPGTIDHEVRRYGGTINAFTSHDSTGVTLFVESQYLPNALDLLSDILQHAVFPPEEFEKERTVVISEIQMNQDEPERRLHHLFWNRHFLEHPYRHPILGYQSLLEQLTVEDMRQHYQAQYIPDNVVVSCVGDVDPRAIAQQLRTAFGSWARRQPYQITVPAEPMALSPKEAHETLPVQASYLMLGFPSIQFAHADLYALDVLANILGHGQTSRLHERLVRTTRLAHGVQVANYTPRDPGVFTIFLRTDPDKAEAAVAETLAMIEQLKQRGVSEAELSKTKRQVVAEYVFGQQTVDSKAGRLANSLALTGDPTYERQYVDGVKGVTVAQVRAVAARYLDPNRMTRVTIGPARETPALPARHAQEMPTVTKTILPNGLTVLLGVDRHLPIGAIVVAAKGGVRIETDRTQGLSNLTSQLLLKGTKGKNATAIATAVESLGGHLDAFSGRDGLGILLQVLSEDLDQGLSLLRELLTESTFPQRELDLQRQLTIQELQAREDDIFQVGARALRPTLFPTHPYRFDPLGTPESLRRLTRAECQAFARRWLVPSNLVLGVFGDIQPASLLKTIRRDFGTLTGPAAPWPPSLNPEPLTTIQRASVSVPKEQSLLLLGFRGGTVTDPDRTTLDVLTALLSGMSGRLFQAVRERHGLAYTVGAFHHPGWDPGSLVLYAATRPGEHTRVLETMKEELEHLVERGFTEQEVEQAKRTLIGSHRLELQQVAGLARRSTLDELFGVGFDAWTAYEEQVQAVTIPMLQQAVRRYLPAASYAEVLVSAGQETGSPSVAEARP